MYLDDKNNSEILHTFAILTCMYILVIGLIFNIKLPIKK